ncbi:MAG: hypothetical protein ACFFAN_06235 [Promethearchaeota archaeon]
MYITYFAKKNEDKEAYLNNLIITIVLIGSITINLFIFSYTGPLYRDFIVFPFDILMLSFIIIYLPLFYFLIFREKRKIKKGNIIINESKSLSSSKELPLKYDIYRKLTHLVVLAIILFYFTLGFLVQNFFLYLLNFLPEFISDIFFSIFSIEGNVMLFTQYLVIFLVGISLIGLLTADFIRILKPELYPLKSVNQILKEKELHKRLGPHISMAVGCFSIIILYGLIQPIGPLIICTSMTMAIFGDISSNLIGRTLGRKYKNIRDTEKTYIGLFAGIIGSFISGIIILLILNEFFNLTLLGFILIPIIGALIIGLLDYLDLEIDDNLSFNFITTTVLFFISIFLIYIKLI